MKRIFTLLLCAALTLSLAVPALAVQSEQETAAAWLKENGILTGDQNGNLNLGSGLTRAELAVILTRLSDDTGDMGRNAAYYRTICPFTDVPEWAMPYAGYCAEKKLMAGYGNKQFGPNDPVTPAAACTVMLRYLDCPANQWSYATACDKAVELGLIPADATTGPSITRGNISILIYRALNGINPGNGADTTVPGVGDGYLTNGKPITEEYKELFGEEAYAKFDKFEYIRIFGQEAYDKLYGDLESIGIWGTWEPCHKEMLGHGIVGVENLGGDLDMIPPGVWFRFNCFPLRWYMGDGSMARCSAEIDEDLLVKDVPTRTYKYGGTGYGEADGNGDSCLEYIQKLFNRNK